jgi:GMP synthase (glutamine-hydrolysing)
MKLRIVMHESFESPAAIKIWAEKKGYGVSYTKLYQGDKFPDECDFDFFGRDGRPAISRNDA